MPYLCTVFFMVLDLRLSKKIGLSGDNPLFLYTPLPLPHTICLNNN